MSGIKDVKPGDLCKLLLGNNYEHQYMVEKQMQEDAEKYKKEQQAYKDYHTAGYPTEVLVGDAYQDFQPYTPQIVGKVEFKEYSVEHRNAVFAGEQIEYNTRPNFKDIPHSPLTPEGLKHIIKTVSRAQDRKDTPITTGVLDYFPDALREVAKCSKAGNDQHNPGQPLHWDRTKSQDHSDCIVRHLLERGTIDDDGIRHSAKVAWRALAMLQVEIEKAKDKK